MSLLLAILIVIPIMWWGARIQINDYQKHCLTPFKDASLGEKCYRIVRLIIVSACLIWLLITIIQAYPNKG